MITEKQLKQMIDNCCEAREQAVLKMNTERVGVCEGDEGYRYSVVWLEKIYVLLTIMEGNRTEEDKEYYPFWWIGQFKMPNGEGWLDFLRDNKDDDGVADGLELDSETNYLNNMTENDKEE